MSSHCTLGEEEILSLKNSCQRCVLELHAARDSRRRLSLSPYLGENFRSITTQDDEQTLSKLAHVCGIFSLIRKWGYRKFIDRVCQTILALDSYTSSPWPTQCNGRVHPISTCDAQIELMKAASSSVWPNPTQHFVLSDSHKTTSSCELDSLISLNCSTESSKTSRHFLHWP